MHQPYSQPRSSASGSFFPQSVVASKFPTALYIPPRSGRLSVLHSSHPISLHPITPPRTISLCLPTSSLVPPVVLVSPSLSDSYVLPNHPEFRRTLGSHILSSHDQLASPNNIVIASARNPASEGLKALAAKSLPGKLVTAKLDVTDYDAYPAIVEEAKKALPEGGLDYLIINAGTDLQTNAAFATGA